MYIFNTKLLNKKTVYNCSEKMLNLSLLECGFLKLRDCRHLGFSPILNVRLMSSMQSAHNTH